MNKKNKRLVAIIIVVLLLLMSAFSQIIWSSFKNLGDLGKSSLNSEEITSFLPGEKTSKENIILEGDSSNRILVIDVKGAIMGEGSGFNLTDYNHSKALNNLDSVKSDDSIKGIILKVDSPGGSVYHSAELWKKLKDVKEETNIPIYTSMGSMAASGGYYIAAATDKIFAAEETITGSIGVISDYVNYSELEEKLGIRHNVFKSDKHKDIGSPSREMTEEERAILQKNVDIFYDKFVKVVAEGRKIPENKVREIADGRTYNGSQALDNQLIDEIGYFEDVVRAMAEDLNLENPEVFENKGKNLDYFSTIFNMTSRNDELSTLLKVRDIYGSNKRMDYLYLYGGY